MGFLKRNCTESNDPISFAPFFSQHQKDQFLSSVRLFGTRLESLLKNKLKNEIGMWEYPVEEIAGECQIPSSELKQKYANLLFSSQVFLFFYLFEGFKYSN